MDQGYRRAVQATIINSTEAPTRVETAVRVSIMNNSSHEFSNNLHIYFQG